VARDLDCGADCVSHQLSLAARAFKAQALAAADVPAETAQAIAAADTEVFRRGEFRRAGLVSVRLAEPRAAAALQQ
jgi:hypothetical protein